jgi:hypothetical protein
MDRAAAILSKALVFDSMAIRAASLTRVTSCSSTSESLVTSSRSTAWVLASSARRAYSDAETISS